MKRPIAEPAVNGSYRLPLGLDQALRRFCIINNRTLSEVVRTGIEREIKFAGGDDSRPTAA